jgi:hypothetical protein
MQFFPSNVAKFAMVKSVNYTNYFLNSVLLGMRTEILISSSEKEMLCGKVHKKDTYTRVYEEEG